MQVKVFRKILFGEHAMKKINFKKKKMKLLTKEHLESYENSKICYNCKKIENEYFEIKNIVKLGIIAFMQENIEVLCIVYVI